MPSTFGIPVRGEEPSGFVDQELVQVRFGMLGRATKSGRGVRDDLRQGVAPYAAAHRDLRRVGQQARTELSTSVSTPLP